MTSISDSELTGRVGVHFVGRICAEAGVAFREIPTTDVGIDALIELRDENNQATGLLAGIQIKSGNSNVSRNGLDFTLEASPKHFEYWAKYCLPILGVIYSPDLNRAVWVDLTEYSNRKPKESLPNRVLKRLDSKTEFNTENLKTEISNLITAFHHRPSSRAELAQVEHLRDKLTAWKRLTTIFLDSESEAEIVGDAGYRISWYFPTATNAQREYFIYRIEHASDPELQNIVVANHVALEANRDDVANLIADLLEYLPNQVQRLKSLGRSKILPLDYLEALFQMIEYFTQDFEGDYREEIGKLYSPS